MGTNLYHWDAEDPPVHEYLQPIVLETHHLASDVAVFSHSFILYPFIAISDQFERHGKL